VDFSRHSLLYAKRQGSQSVSYIEADYLVDDLPSGFDLVTLIYTDFCSLSAEQRKQLLKRMRSMLNPGGHVALDVAGIASLSAKKERTIIEARLMDGFWAPDDYIGMQRTYVYSEECISLDRYLIVQPNDSWQIFNWTQHFTPLSIEEELGNAGFQVNHRAGDLSGRPLVADLNP
jgi:SAM-dependent methyltransferase